MTDMTSHRIGPSLKTVMLALASLATSACTLIPDQTSPAAVSPEVEAVESYVSAFNARDLEAMRKLMHQRIQWLSVDGTQIGTVSYGRETLSQDLRGYFETGTDVISTLSGISQNGPYVSTVEAVTWTGENGEAQTQSSLAVYELSGDGLIRRVWYFPEVPGTP